MQSIQDKVALVTGSSRGIGAAIARRFAWASLKVVVHGRDSDAASAVLRSIQEEGGTAMLVTADVTRFDEIEAMRRQVEQSFGPVEILVANAHLFQTNDVGNGALFGVADGALGMHLKKTMGSIEDRPTGSRGDIPSPERN